MVEIQQKIELIGPFFQHDPGKTLYRNIGDMMDRLAPELEAKVREDIEGHRGEMPFWTGYTAKHVAGYTVSPKTGRVWALWAAVGIPTPGMSRAQAIRTKAAGQ